MAETERGGIYKVGDKLVNASGEPVEQEPEGFDPESATKEELEAELERRQEAGESIEVEGTGKDGAVLKADLVKALS